MDISKIRKLIEKEQSCRSIGNQAEADAFLSKIQELLMEYNLDMSSIKEETKTESGIRQESILVDNRYQSSLLKSICDNFMCRVVDWLSYNEKDGSSIGWNKKIIIGKVYNIEACIYMFKFYWNEVMLLSIASYRKDIETRKLAFGGDWKKVEKSFDDAHRQKYIEDYYLGCIHGIAARMRDDKASMKANAQDLMVINDSAVSLYIEDNFELIKYEEPENGKKQKKVKYRKMTKKEIAASQVGNGYSVGYRDGYSVEKGETRVTGGEKRIG